MSELSNGPLSSFSLPRVAGAPKALVSVNVVGPARMLPAHSTASAELRRPHATVGGAPVARDRPSAGFGQRSPKVSDSAVGREIRDLRRSLGRTQKELARVIGVTGAQLHRYETGATRIAASRLIAIAEALGVRPDVLIAAGSVSDPPPPPPVFSDGADDIVKLIQVFGTIGDPKHRSALVAVACMMADHYARDARRGQDG